MHRKAVLKQQLIYDSSTSPFLSFFILAVIPINVPDEDDI